MNNVYVISDLHLGHKNILNFAGEYRSWADSIEEHDHILIERIRATCRKKRDLLFILGDVCMDINKLEMLDEIQCRKILIRGNHDNFQDGVYRKYFERIEGFMRYKNLWLSHAPIHPLELRGKKNVHGHVHQNSIPDNRYINACVENCNGWPINMRDIRNGTFEGEIK